jgi:acetolactate synthase-1/2/3 large subunit
MRSEIVPKPWGYEYCAFDNGAAAVWILHIGRGRGTSRHCHPNKRTRLVVLQGEVQFNGKTLQPLERVIVEKGDFHQTVVWGCETASQNGAFVMEIEEPSDKADIVRADDAYGRAGKPIESETIPCNGELLKLTHKGQSIMGYHFKLESTIGGEMPDLTLDVGGDILGIYREPTKKLSDCVADFVKALGVKHVFGVCGGGAMHLNDSFRDFFVPTHHEQAAAMAADAYGRVAGIGCALVTTGPGGTNAVTGVACAWVDSTPLLVISGQVPRHTLIGKTGVRQFGVQETDIVTLVSSITKYAVTVMDERDIRFELEKAAYLVRTGRPGPVWIDIPLDIQSKQVNWDSLRRFEPPAPPLDETWDISALRAERPVLVIGNGVHLASAEEDCRRIVDEWRIPVVSSWAAADIIPTDHPLYIGRFGIFGDRAANFTVQNADLLIVLGCRLSIPQTGHNFATFARGARIVMVDVDEAEMSKPSIHVEHKIRADVGAFLLTTPNPKYDCEWWTQRCQEWKRNYPVVAGEKREGEEINSYHFIEALCKALPDDAVVVTDMGTAFTCTFQAANIKLGQRWITAAGHAPMGYGLPGAIGAHYATRQPVVCIVGDGSLQFNIQELQTIASRKLPIAIFVIENGGYLAMKHTFANHFGRQVGSDAASGLTFPETYKIANAYGLETWLVSQFTGLESLERALRQPRPFVAEVWMDKNQPLIPRSSSMKRPDGSIASKPIEDLYPFLPREEFRAQMIVPPVEVFE